MTQPAKLHYVFPILVILIASVSMTGCTSELPAPTVISAPEKSEKPQLSGKNSAPKKEDIATWPILSAQYEVLRKGIQKPEKHQKSDDIEYRDKLLKRAFTRADGVLVWGLDSDHADRRCPHLGEFDAFGDGTCNPASTGYAFESGLAMTALLAITPDDDITILQTVKKSLFYWLRRGQNSAECSRCLYIPYSDSDMDKGRFVRGLVARMAAVSAALVKKTGDRDIASYLERLMETAEFEIKRGNKGYLSVADPQFSLTASLNTENHLLGGTALSFFIVAQYTHDSRAMAIARNAYETWANCSWGACAKYPLPPCDIWAGNPECVGGHAFGHCLFAGVSEQAARKCERLKSLKKPFSTYEKLLVELGEADISVH